MSQTAGLPDYTVFGLRVRSGLELPELFHAEGEGEPDVSIEAGPIDAPESGPGLVAVEGGLLLTIADVARFLISNGRTVRVEAHSGVDPRNVRLFLLGSAFGALLHQRGLLPLHANAIEIDGKAVAFMGESGAGKSTLAARFNDRGYRVLADDVCVVSPWEPSGPLVAPGLPRLRLWAEALQATGREAQAFERSYIGETVYDKYDVPLAGQTQSRLPLAGVYLLGRGDRLRFEQIEGTAAAGALFAHTYRGTFVAQAGRQVDHWASCVELLRKTPLFQVDRVWGLDAVDEGAQAILDHATWLIGGDLSLLSPRIGD